MCSIGESLYKRFLTKELFKKFVTFACDREFNDYDMYIQTINNVINNLDNIEYTNEIFITKDEFMEIEGFICIILSKPVPISFRLAIIHFIEKVINYFNEDESFILKNYKLIETLFEHAVASKFGVPSLNYSFEDMYEKTCVSSIRHYCITICGKPSVFYAFTDLFDNPLLMNEVYTVLERHTDRLLTIVGIKVDNRYKRRFNYIERCTLESNILELIFNCIDIYINNGNHFEQLNKKRLLSTIGDIQCRLGYMIHTMKTKKSLSSEIIIYPLKKCISTMLWLIYSIACLVSKEEDAKYVTNYFQVLVRMVFNLYVYELGRKKSLHDPDEPNDYKLSIIALWKETLKIENKFQKYIVRISRIKRDEVMKYDDVLDHFDMEEALSLKVKELEISQNNKPYKREILKNRIYNNIVFK